MSRKLDFICVGATKAGTTSLFHYLKEHKDIFLPPRKEVFFFDIDNGESWTDFYQENFQSAQNSQVVGKFSPRYSRHPKISELLYEHNPDLKIIYLVRNPIYRAFSHYRMLFRLERERRSFSELIGDQLREENLTKCRETNLPGEYSLFTQGEYGRITASLLEDFKKEQILVIPSDELESSPQVALSKVYEFLGVSLEYPSNLNKKYHVGGDKARYKWLLPFLKVLVVPKVIWQFLGSSFKKRIILWYNTSLRISKKREMTLQENEKKRLIEFYREDVSKLNQLFDLKLNWKEFL